MQALGTGYLEDLQERATELMLALRRLQCIVDEVQKRAGIASRRKTVSHLNIALILAD